MYYCNKQLEYLFWVGLICLAFIVITELELYIKCKIMEIIIFGFCCRVIIIYLMKYFFSYILLLLYKNNFIMFCFVFFSIYNILRIGLEFDKLLLKMKIAVNELKFSYEKNVKEYNPVQDMKQMYSTIGDYSKTKGIDFDITIETKEEIIAKLNTLIKNIDKKIEEIENEKRNN